MRKKIVAGNWKMNLNLEEGKALINGILEGVAGLSEEKQVVLAPSFVHLASVGELINGVAHVSLSAQNCAAEAAGAYTGEVSATMLQSAGAGYVILGHSERREYFSETDALLAKKIDLALSAGLKVIFCCGEPLEIRDAATQNAYVEAQLKASLYHLSEAQLKDIVIAYEPIWAIGTGRTASADQAQEMHAHIRSVLSTQYGAAAADDMSILYGGSAKPSNAPELFACPDVDGGLIGGASLKAADFIGIIEAMIAN